MKNLRENSIIIIGFGSIGKRHYRNLLNMGYENIQVFDTDDNSFKGAKVQRIKKINQKTLAKSDIVLICNPNNKHIEFALKCARVGCCLLIEKPLSHNLKNISVLKKICREKRIINLVACNMRFHPGLKFIKKYIDKGRLGKIYRIDHEFGYYLPYWRAKQDYRKNYAVKKSNGGGIILDDIHEFDLLFWLNDFSDVVDSKFLYNKSSRLEIETEDNCVAIFKFKNNVLGTVRCDYLEQSYSRTCKVVGEKGNLFWDFKENIVWLKNKNNKKALFEIKNYDLNQMYIDELKYYFDCVKDNKETFNVIDRAAQVLKYCVERK